MLHVLPQMQPAPSSPRAVLGSKTTTASGEDAENSDDERNYADAADGSLGKHLPVERHPLEEGLSAERRYHGKVLTTFKSVCDQRSDVVCVVIRRDTRSSRFGP